MPGLPACMGLCPPSARQPACSMALLHLQCCLIYCVAVLLLCRRLLWTLFLLCSTACSCSAAYMLCPAVPAHWGAGCRSQCLYLRSSPAQPSGCGLAAQPLLCCSRLIRRKAGHQLACSVYILGAGCAASASAAAASPADRPASSCSCRGTPVGMLPSSRSSPPPSPSPSSAALAAAAAAATAEVCAIPTWADWAVLTRQGRDRWVGGWAWCGVVVWDGGVWCGRLGWGGVGWGVVDGGGRKAISR